MSKAPLRCVIDANVALKLFFEQPLSDKAEALFAHLVADPRARFYVPDFFFAECVSALVNYVRMAKYPAEDAKQDMDALQALALTVVPTLEVAAPALALAIGHRLNGYDACYVALAQRLGVPLVTADDKLVRATAGQFDVCPLASFEVALP